MIQFFEKAGLATDESVKDITGECFYRCKIANTSKSAEDENLAKELFEYSDELAKDGSEARQAIMTTEERSYFCSRSSIYAVYKISGKKGK